MGGKRPRSPTSSLHPTRREQRLEAEKEFAHHWFPEFEHQEIREIEADGIGEESWAVRGGTDDSGFVEIGWRRANATLAVYVNCRPCESDLADAARRWARRSTTRHALPPTDLSS